MLQIVTFGCHFFHALNGNFCQTTCSHFTLLFFHPILFSSYYSPRAPSVVLVAQIRGLIAYERAGPLPPSLRSPHYDTCLHFYREKTSAFYSLVDSRGTLCYLINIKNTQCPS